MSHTSVIAEVGSAHVMQLDIAMELVRMAKQVNADAVKFQYWSNAAALAKQRNAEAYLDAYAGYALPIEWIAKLRDVADAIGIGFMCTAFLPDDVAAVAPYVDAFKIASFEALYRPTIDATVQAMAGNEKPLYVSLGMGQSLGLFERAVVGRDVDLDRIVPLHCVSAYPAPHRYLNLRRITDLRMAHGSAGYSDHGDPRPMQKRMIGAMAVAAGASVIEAHLRLDSTPRHNPDFPHSMGPSEFADYVWTIRSAETMLGSGEGMAQAVEAPMMKFIASEEAIGVEAKQKPGKAKR